MGFSPSSCESGTVEDEIFSLRERRRREERIRGREKGGPLRGLNVFRGKHFLSITRNFLRVHAYSG